MKSCSYTVDDRQRTRIALIQRNATTFILWNNIDILKYDLIENMQL